MAAVDRLRRLVDHLEWANRRALDAARESGSDEALRLLSHLIGAERVWLRRLETGDSSELEIWPDLDFDACARLLRENVDALRGRLDGLDPEALGREVTYRNSKGTEFHTPLGEILLHVLLHGAYHRGQIAVRIRDGGGEPVNTDFITFVREEPAPGNR